MAGGRDRVLRALEELSARELRHLKVELNRLPVAAGTIPRGTMEDADAVELTQLLVGRYREDNAATVVAAALRRIHRLDLADMVGGDNAPSDALDAPSPSVSPSPAPPSPAELFVWRHQVALIERGRGAAAILDRLVAAGVVTLEEASRVAAAPTPQEQMRRLLAGAPAWGRRGHRVFVSAVRRLLPGLVEDLESREGDADQ